MFQLIDCPCLVDTPITYRRSGVVKMRYSKQAKIVHLIGVSILCLMHSSRTSPTTSPVAVAFSIQTNRIPPSINQVHDGEQQSINQRNFFKPYPSSSASRSDTAPRKPSFWQSFSIAALLSASLLFTNPLPSHASSYYALSDEQKLVAEAWRLVDNSFLDRTFNRQDWFALRQEYVNQRYDSITDAQQAIAQLLGTLGDPYTRYLNPGVYQSMVDSATGTLAGVGVEISKDGPFVVASDVQDGSPAAAAGIRPGDIFVQVDGYTVTERDTPDDVALRLRGPVGSKVGVVMRRGEEGNYAVDTAVTRQPLTIVAVKSYMAEKGVGVIRIKNFSGTTAEAVGKQWKDLRKKGAKTMVMDLRGNPGGLLPGGVDTASLFLESNSPVVFVVNKQGIVDAQSTFASGFDLETPIILLVDENTASAAEVFTAALQENGRAVVAGHQTFGKGIVQTVRELSNNNGGLAITVARYETPSHKNINKQGIQVSIETSTACAKDDATKCLTPSAFQAKPISQI